MTQEEKIQLVIDDIRSKFPKCSYTIRILLWDDGTDLVECRHGTKDILYISSYYDNKLSFEEIPLDKFHHGMLVDENGTEYFKRK